MVRDRYDERDTIFSRMLLTPGTGRYLDYYRSRPELEAIDARLRDAPPGVFSDREPENSEVETLFGIIEKLRPLVRGITAAAGIAASRPEFPRGIPQQLPGIETALRQLAASLGAADFGICDSTPDFFYSVRGRGERYGRPVETVLPVTIVLAFEMDREKTAAAPSITETVEVARTYLDAAVCALAVREFIGQLGCQATAHIDGESELILPPAAAAAGIGKIGRHGLLVHPEYGSRVRLSAVTTDLPLSPSPAPSSGASSFDMVDFCEKCGACASFCPKGSIPAGPADRLWQVDHESCYEGWKEFGSDCGVCLAVCPFSRTGKGGHTMPGSPDFLKSFMYGGGDT
jgi:ferredoxin